MVAQDLDLRVLGPTSIEDLHAHLLRLDSQDRRLFFSSDDDHAVDAFCLRLLSAPAILIGAYEGACMRASITIVPDRNCRRAKATFIAEAGYRSDALAQGMIERAENEAFKHHLGMLEFAAPTGAPPVIATQMARLAMATA